MQVKYVKLAHPREFKSSISNTIKNVTVEFLTVNMQVKYVASVHPRQCKSSSSKIEKIGAGDRLPVTKKMFE